MTSNYSTILRLWLTSSKINGRSISDRRIPNIKSRKLYLAHKYFCLHFLNECCFTAGIILRSSIDCWPVTFCTDEMLSYEMCVAPSCRRCRGAWFSQKKKRNLSPNELNILVHQKRTSWTLKYTLISDYQLQIQCSCLVKLVFVV